MTTVAFDTLKLATHLQKSGFTKKQAFGAAEGLADAIGEGYASKDTMIVAVQDAAIRTNMRIDAAESRLSERIDGIQSEIKGIHAVLAEHGTKLGCLERGQANLEQRQINLEQRQENLERGQAVLMENQLQTNTALAAIMAHLGIPKP